MTNIERTQKKRGIAKPKAKPAGADSGSVDGVRASLLRRSVLDAAAKLFSVRGYQGTSLQDVATTLGVSRPTIYYYFNSKDKLLEALVEEVTESRKQQTEEIAGREGLSPEDALRLIVCTHAAWLLENGTLFLAIERSDMELPEDLHDRNQAAKRAVLKNFAHVIDAGVKQGRFRPVNPQVGAFALLGMCNWTAFWYKPDGAVSKEEVVDTIADLAVGGLLRSDAHRDRSDDTSDAFRILREDMAHLERLVNR